MDCITVSTELLDSKRRHYNKYKDNYKLDMWEELKKRWMILGVLVSILLAVISPRVGAPGGPLQPELASLAPLWLIYFAAGRRYRTPRARPALLACALSVLHAHVVGPTLCAMIAIFADDAGLHRTLVKGAVLSCAGGPRAWQALSATAAPEAVPALAASYAASLLAAPATLYIICGRAPVPVLGPTILSAMTIVPPFLIGLLYTYTQNSKERSNVSEDERKYTQVPQKSCSMCECNSCTQSASECARCGSECGSGRGAGLLGPRLCGLVLLYFDCCERLREAEGSLHLQDVLGTMCFAVCYVCASALSARVWPRGARRAVLACSLPRALHEGWSSPAACSPAGLARLPAAFLASAQALVLAATHD